jgi:hypothetical protein
VFQVYDREVAVAVELKSALEVNFTVLLSGKYPAENLRAYHTVVIV